jgi:hypothetical protein
MNFKGMTMALIYKSLYSIICILPTYFLDLGYAASFGYLPNTYVLQLQSLFSLSFWRKEAGIHIMYWCYILPFFYQYSSAYGKRTSNGLVCFTRSGFHVTDSCLLVTLTEWDGWFQYFMPLPKQSREVVFTSSTVTKVTLTEWYGWLPTEKDISRNVLVFWCLYLFFFFFLSTSKVKIAKNKK